MHEKPDLAEMFKEHELRVFAYLRRMVSDRDTAADLTQDTFLRALRVAHRYRGEASVTTWLLGIARHIFLEWTRKQIDRPVDPPPDRAQPTSFESVDVERTLSALALEHREVLVLRFVLDLPGEEVARILDVSHEAVRQRTVRARRAFKEVWDP